jgi:hypothetical protein
MTKEPIVRATGKRLWLAAGLVTAIGLLGLGFCAGMYLHL